MFDKPFNNASLKGHWSFLFFGYSTCPNICPTTLGAMNQISQRLGASVNVQFVFITIDPVHDTTKHLREYLQQDKYSATSFIGVTGNKDTITELAKSIGIYVAQDKDKQITVEHIEHGGAILLINPEGKLNAIFTTTDNPQAIVHDFKQIVHHYVNAV
jgi:protein SCO1/2